LKAGSKVVRTNPISLVDRKIGLKPLHPGELLREEFLIPLGMTTRMLAHEIRVPERRVVAIVKEKKGLDGEICLRLARFFRMTPGFWMNCQMAYELRTAVTNWPKICREVRMHPKDHKTGALKVPKVKG
jgi:addiction module HigA family antidote